MSQVKKNSTNNLQLYNLSWELILVCTHQHPRLFSSVTISEDLIRTLKLWTENILVTLNHQHLMRPAVEWVLQIWIPAAPSEIIMFTTTITIMAPAPMIRRWSLIYRLQPKHLCHQHQTYPWDIQECLYKLHFINTILQHLQFGPKPFKSWPLDYDYKYLMLFLKYIFYRSKKCTAVLYVFCY